VLDGLNPEQTEAVLHGDGPLLVFAGAGSGKTKVLTTRIAYLVKERGVDPELVLAITFTNKAAREMKERIGVLLGRGASKMWVATFHSACLRLLRPYAELIGLRPGFTILSDDDTRRVVKNAIDDCNYDPKLVSPAGAETAISRWKNQLLTPKQAWQGAGTSDTDIKRARIYEAYQKLLVEANVVDFDGILFYMVVLLRDHPDVRERIQGRFTHIFVDEYQDTNVAQNEIIRMLGAIHQNVCVVGDADQSIYRFRCAEIKNIMQFEKTFPGARTITLERNYRSTKKILDAANAVIEHNVMRPPKNLWTDEGGGAQIVIERHRDDTVERQWLAGEVVRLLNRGMKGGDIAVLCRIKAVGQEIETALLAREVPCKLVGGTAFLARAHIRDALGYLRMVVNPNDETAFRRIVNVPRRAIGDTSIKKIRSKARAMALPLGEAVRRGADLDIPVKAQDGLSEFVAVLDAARELDESGVPASETLELIFDRTKFRDDILKLGADVSGYKLRDIDTLVELAMSYPNVERFLEEVALMSETDDEDTSDRRVRITTIHSAKGLEWSVVFVPAMEENIFPDGRSDSDEDIEEERRLAYVAITRARERLYLSSARRRMIYGKFMDNAPSRFLAEIPEHLAVPAAMAS
jgi:DNA helicase-2/ATP-dependent DNA helicase PcrA